MWPCQLRGLPFASASDVDKHLALLVAFAIGSVRLMKIGLETIVDVFECVFMNMSDGGVQIIQSGEDSISVVSKSC